MLSLGANKARSRSAELLVIVLNPYLCPLREGWDSSNEINICYQVIKNIQALKKYDFDDVKGGCLLATFTLNSKTMDSLSPVSG